VQRRKERIRVREAIEIKIDKSKIKFTGLCKEKSNKRGLRERSLGMGEQRKELLALKWAITVKGKVIRKEALTWGYV
jgi:hypothetical protein